MDIFLRTFTIYLFLLVVLRLSGKHTLSELSTFDFILLLIISEATQNALIEEDYSLTRAMAVIVILVALDLTLSILKSKYAAVEKITEGTPVLLVDNGKLLDYNMKKTHVTCDDILQAARLHQGLERLDQIRYAVLENSGGISIIPMQPDIEAVMDRRIEEALRRRERQGPASSGGA